jgi:hypothetical protein
MKNIILATLFLFSQISIAADPPASIKGQSGTKQIPKWNLQVPFNQATNLGGIDSLIETGNMNLLADPGMEAPNTSSWVADGGATLSKTTNASDVAFGSRALSMVSIATGQARSIAIAIPEGLKGQNGYAQCRIKIPSLNTGSYIYVSTSTTASTNMLAYSSTLSSATNYTPLGVNFVFPTSGSVYLWVYGSSAQTVDVDDCYVGPALNISQVSQAKNVVQFTWSGSQTATHDTDVLFTWSGATQTRLENFTHSSGVLTATVAGDYVWQFCPRLDYTSGSSSTVRAMIAKAYKNSSTVPLEGGVSGYIAGLAQNNINAGGESPSGSLGQPPPCTVGTTTLAVGDTLRFKAYQANGSGSNFNWIAGALQINFFPTISQQAVSMNSTPSYWAGYHDTTCSWARTSTSYGDFTADASCALVQRTAANISCVATGSVLPGVACAFPKAGVYHVCGTFASYGGAQTNHGFRLWDGTTTIVEAGSVNAANDTISLCGIYTLASTSATFTIQGKSASSSVNIDAVGANSVVEWRIWPLGQNEPMPILAGGVTTGGSGMSRIEHARISQASGVYTLQEHSGGITSILKNAEGDVSLFFSPAFTGEMVCTAIPEGGCLITTINTAHSASEFRFNMYTSSFAAACNTALYVTCMGVK